MVETMLLDLVQRASPPNGHVIAGRPGPHAVVRAAQQRDGHRVGGSVAQVLDQTHPAGPPGGLRTLAAGLGRGDF